MSKQSFLVNDKFIIELIKQSISTNSKNIDVYDIIEDNPSLINQLLISDKYTKSVFELALSSREINCLNKFALFPEVAKELNKSFVRLSELGDAGQIDYSEVPQVIQNLIHVHADYLKNKSSQSLSNEPLFFNFVGNFLIDYSQIDFEIYKKAMNLRMRDALTPVFFELLNYFKDCPEELLQSDLIEWGRIDKRENTVFHHMLSYDKNLYPTIISQIEAAGGWKHKNINSETPLDLWIKQINRIEDVAKFSQLLDMNIINWDGQDSNLVELLKRTMKIHNSSKNNEELFYNVFFKISHIPQFKSKKVKSYLEVFFNHHQNNTSPQASEKVSFLEKAFQKANLEESLIINEELNNKKMKI